MTASGNQMKNYEYFKKSLPELLSDKSKAGKFAIIYDITVEGLFDTFEAAYREACLRYEDDFIIQQIIDDCRIVNYLAPAAVL